MDRRSDKEWLVIRRWPTESGAGRKIPLAHGRGRHGAVRLAVLTYAVARVSEEEEELVLPVNQLRNRVQPRGDARLQRNDPSRRPGSAGRCIRVPRSARCAERCRGAERRLWRYAECAGEPG